MHPAWKRVQDNTKGNEHRSQNASMFPPNVTMLPKSTTGLEDKPLLPSVFRPNSALYTTPMDVRPKTYSNNSTGGLNTPTGAAILPIHGAPTQLYFNNASAYGSPNVPAIQKPDFNVTNIANPASFRPFLPHEVSVQNRFPVPLPGSNESSLGKPGYSQLQSYHNVPQVVLARNIVPIPHANTSTSVEMSTSTSHLYTNTPLQPHQRTPTHCGIPNIVAKYDQRLTRRWASQNTGIPFDSAVQPVFPIKPVSTIHSNLVKVNTSDEPSSTDLKSKKSLTYSCTDPSVYNPSMASCPLDEQREYSFDLDTRRPFFGEVKLSSDFRDSTSLGSFADRSVGLTNREITSDYENRYREGCEDIRLSEGVKKRPTESEYLHDKYRGYYNDSSLGDDKIDRLYTSDANALSSYEEFEKSSYLEDMACSPKGHQGFHDESRDRPRIGRSSGSGRSYSKESSRARSRSHSPAQRRRRSSRSGWERAESSKREYNISREKDKLGYDGRRLSSERSRDSRHSAEKRRRRSSASPRRRNGSSSKDGNERSAKRLSETKSEKAKRTSSPRRSLSSRDEKGRNTSRALKCFCLPDPNIERKFVYEQSSRYYQSSSTSQKSTSTARDNVTKLHKEFKDMLSKSPAVEECATTSSTVTDAVQDSSEDSQYVSELLDKADDEDKDVSSGSDVDLEGYDVIDVYDSDSSDDDATTLPSNKENKFKNQEHPRKLHPELWFNVEGELNHGKECLCSLKDKQKWIVHNVYPNEQPPKVCEALGNNGLKLYHYWVTVFPHPNFMTENPTTVECNGRTYTFEGFSLLSHSPLDVVPRCSLTRFNFKYEIFFIQEPIPTNFCIKDLDLFSKFLFYDILEMYDWKFEHGKESEENCNMFHFLPRFTHRLSASNDGCEEYELLSMRKVFEHLIKSRKPLITEEILAGDRKSWKDFTGSCVNSLVTRPGWKPSSIRIDEIERSQNKDQPVIVHHGIRPVQLSFSGDPKCQRLMKKYLKMRTLITNKPDASQKERLQLIKIKLTLENMKMKDSLRRNCCVHVSTVGMVKTGLNSDVTQHALLLPVLVHHVRCHLSFQTFDEKIGYVFKDRSLLRLALTHPSYVMNYGTNPDHARNTLSNCGVKEPRYGDRRNRLSHTKKKGIVQLIDIMAKLEDLDGSQSFVQHNERLEFLGDAILEFICTCHLYFLFPEMPEGGLVTHRSSLVQNRHLAEIAKKLELDNFMQFSHGPDLCHQEDMEHAMANCFEAILGAIYLDSDVKTVQKVFSKLVFEEGELRKLWCSLPGHPLQEQQPDGDRSVISSSNVLKGLVKLEEAVGIQFKHIRLLARAFTHPQVGYNNLTLGNNQRMELLGDSLVQWVVTDYLYQHFPEHHEGHLTLLRSSLVNRNIQAQIAGEIGLDQYVHFGVGPGVPKLRQKHMSDLFEAFLAAMFVDKGIEPVEVFCKVCLFPKLKNVIVNQEWMDAKSQLQSCCLTQSSHADSVPVYKVLQNIGSPNMKLFTVGVYFSGRRLGTGFGDNIREAEMNAAQNALATNYFPEYARQKRVVHRKHKINKRV